MVNIIPLNTSKKWRFCKFKTNENQNELKGRVIQNKEDSNNNIELLDLLRKKRKSKSDGILRLKKLLKCLLVIYFWLDLKYFFDVIKWNQKGQTFDDFNIFKLTEILKAFDYKLIKFINAQVFKHGDHIYFYSANPSSVNQFALNDLISGCTSASITQKIGAGCSLLSISMESAGPLTTNYPRPNLECSIQVSCLSPSSSAQIFIVSSFTRRCSSFSPENIQYQTPKPLAITDYVFQQGAPATSINLAATDIATINLPFVVQTCTIYDLDTTQAITMPYITPTTSYQATKNYFVFCDSTNPSCQAVISNAFTITVLPECIPSVTIQPSPSFSNQVLSTAIPVILIATGYASTTNPALCILSYSFLNQDDTTYTGTDLSIVLSDGAVSITSNILFTANLKIKVTSTYSTTSINSVTSNVFTVDQVCGSFCTPTISGIISTYNLNVQSSSQIILNSYATTTNPLNCIMTYSLYQSGGSLYSGTDFSISPTTGIISTQNLNDFTSSSIWISVTSTDASLPCLGTQISSAFIVSVQCLVQCTPSITGITQSTYSFQIQSYQQTLLQSYASNPSGCTMSYSLQNQVGNTPYTGSDIVISSTTGTIQTQNLNIFTTASLQITVTSINSQNQCSGTVTSSSFIVTGCLNYCMPTISGITQPTYSFQVQSYYQTLIQSYATTTNPSNCIMTFSIQNLAGNTPYTGNDITISSTTGVISTTNLDIFTTEQLKIIVSSTYSTYSCSGIVESPAFVIQTQCSGYCQPLIQNTIQPIYNTQFTNSQQILFQLNATTSNSQNCFLSYNMIHALNRSQYQGSLFQLQSSTGKIQVTASQSFYSPLIIIQVTSQSTFSQCSDFVNTVPFQINAQKTNCQKVKLVPPQNFKYLKVLSVDGPNFIYKNFTTSNLDCKIFSHKIINSQDNQNVPTGFMQTKEGQSQFMINIDSNFIKIPSFYDFLIKVQILDGQIFYKQAQIFVDKCDQDQIFLNKSQTRFTFNQTAGFTFQIDLGLYFHNLYSKACPLAYKINKVVSDGNFQIDHIIYDSLFKINENYFEISSQTNIIFTGYKIYIHAQNRIISSNNSQTLILIASINQPQNQNLMQNLSVLEPTQYNNKQQKFNIFQRNNITNETNQPVLIKDTSMSDSGILKISFNQNLKVPEFAQVALNLSNNKSINQSSYFPLNITTFESLFDILQLRQIIQFKIICNSIIDQKYLNFEIRLLKWNSQSIEVFVNFTYPEIVSIGKRYDQLSFQILNGSNFTSNASTKEQLDIYKNGYFEVDIPPQSLLLESKAKQIAIVAQSSMTSTVIIQSTFLMAMKKAISPIQKLLLNLQMQADLKYYQVTLPYQAYFYLQVVNQTIEFEIDWNSLLSSIGININWQQYFNIQIIKSPQFPSNLQRAGTNTLNVLSNMKSVLIVIATFLMLNMVAPIFLIFNSSKNGFTKYIKQQYSNLKFNGLIRSLTVGLLNQANTIIIIFMYYINQKWKDFKTLSKNEQIQNICLWTFILIFLASLPGIFFLKLHFNKDSLKDKEFIETYGVLIEKMKLRKPSTKYVYPLLLLNRLVFAFIPVAFFNIPSLQIIFLILESFLYNAFVIQAKVKIDWAEYYQDVFNEYSLLVMYTLLTLFGDTGLIFCLDSNIQIEKKIYAQQIAGIVFASIGISVVVINIGLLCKKQVKTLYLIFVKQHNIWMAKSALQNNDKELLEYDIELSQTDKKEKQIEGPNILILGNIKQKSVNDQQGREDKLQILNQNIIIKNQKNKGLLQKRKQNSIIQLQKREKILYEQDRKVVEIFNKIKQQIQDQKHSKKEEKKKWEKQNQSKTLKKLIEKPKEFLKPKLIKIQEENEMIKTPQTKMTALSQAKQNYNQLNDKFQSKINTKNEIQLLQQELKYNVKINADQFMKKHGNLQKIDSDECLKKNIENIFRIINTPNYDELIEGRTKTELASIRDIMKIDLILLKSSQSYKDYKFWEKKIELFEKDSNQLLSGYL